MTVNQVLSFFTHELFSMYNTMNINLHKTKVLKVVTITMKIGHAILKILF